MSLFLLNLLLTCCGVLGEVSSLSGPPYPSDDILTELSDVPSPFVSTIDGSYPNEEVVEFIPAFLPFRGTVKPTPSDEFLEDLLEFFSTVMVDPGDPDLVFFPSDHQETGHPIRTGSIVPVNRSPSVLPYPRTSPVNHDRDLRGPSRKLETAAKELIPRGSKQSSTALQAFGAATSDATPLKRLMCITLLRPVRLQQPDPRSSNTRQRSSTAPVIQAVTSYYWYGKGKRKRCPETLARGSEHRPNKNNKINSSSLIQNSKDQTSHLRQPLPRRKNITMLKPPPTPPMGKAMLKPPPTLHHHSASKSHPNHGHLLKSPPTAARSSTPQASSSLPSGVELVNLTAIYGSSGSNCTCLPVNRCPEGRGRKAARCGRIHVCCPDELLLHTKCGVLEHEARRDKSPGVGPLSAPWAATILLKTPSGYAFVCGGALIHPRAVITDARCVRR
ncbi:uncharacterized protein LOC122392339 [Amphibalanus amphitrite]|uniref:uncharacterized protein LOC122392339 n=1 Tax=Amphibalanus amphitrite TaxID=1232801 RepID=UPI001C91AF33|nr:uncharacterized protein LOC122392339 [Amphibalanus amphitrite]